MLTLYIKGWIMIYHIWRGQAVLHPFDDSVLFPCIFGEIIQIIGPIPVKYNFLKTIDYVVFVVPSPQNHKRIIVFISWIR